MTKINTIHEFAKVGNLDEISVLLSQGVDINERDPQGYTPLHWVCQEGYEQLGEFLIEKGANVDATSDKGVFPLELAAKGHINIVRLLIAHKCDVLKDRDGFTALHSAAAYGHADITSILIEKGINVNNRDQTGYTPLHWAVQDGYLDVVKVLLKAGADKEIGDNSGFTPLHKAVGEGHTEVVRYLIAHGANVNSHSDKSGTPLHTACAWGRQDIVDILLKNGADVEDKDTDGRTPLFFAVMYRHIEIVELLIAHGANVTVQDKRGKRIIDIAKSKKMATILLAAVSNAKPEH